MAVYALDGQAPDLPAEGSYWIAETAVVIGRVRLKGDASIWWGSVLRGDNEWIELGERSNIQESCTLHTDMGFPLVIGPDCTIGHNAVLHGCMVAAGSLIGPDSVKEQHEHRIGAFLSLTGVTAAYGISALVQTRD